MTVFTGHARDRAFERYGLALTDAELTDIANACITGKAPVLRSRQGDGGMVHRWTFNGMAVYPVIAQGKLVTFLPLDFFFASSARAHRNVMKRAPRVGQGLRGRDPYKRDRTNLRRIAEDGDE